MVVEDEKLNNNQNDYNSSLEMFYSQLQMLTSCWRLSKSHEVTRVIRIHHLETPHVQDVAAIYWVDDDIFFKDKIKSGSAAGTFITYIKTMNNSYEAKDKLSVQNVFVE